MDEYTSVTGKKFAAGGSSSKASVAFTEDTGSGDSLTGAWEEFCGTAAFQLMAKYMALADKLAKEPITHKQFAEQRPLGRGAFGAVFLVFKKARTDQHTTRNSRIDASRAWHRHTPPRTWTVEGWMCTDVAAREESAAAHGLRPLPDTTTSAWHRTQAWPWPPRRWSRASRRRTRC